MSDVEVWIFRIAMIATTVINVIGFCQSIENLRIARETQDEAKKILKRATQHADTAQKFANRVRID